MKQEPPIPIAALLVATSALAFGLYLAWHHPLSPVLAAVGCSAVALLCAAIPNAWLVLLPAVLPVIDLAPWTGWLTFEEFDILVLGAAAGAWFRHARISRSDYHSPPSMTMLVLVVTCLSLLAISLARGLHDGGGFRFGWFQGYEGPMNSVRLGKSFVLAALFAPLLGHAMSRRNPGSVTSLAWGMAIGLATASLAATWERMAFPGLLNFSSDYRTTALFWEMHVGGAALDGFLALTLPFAVLLILRTHGVSQWLPAAVILVLGIYAGLTTFSRGVYLAAVASMATMALFLIVRREPGTSPVTIRSRLTQGMLAIFWIAIILGLSQQVFHSGGYRALVAVLGCLAAWMLASRHARQAPPRTWAIAIAVSLLLTVIDLAAGWLTAKGGYWAYGLTLTLAMAAVLAIRILETQVVRALMLAAMLALPVAAMQVAEHWGGTRALGDTAIATLLIVGLGIWHLWRKPVWPITSGRRGALLTGIFALSAVTAVFSGGAYIGGRFSTSEQDLEGRLQHWRAGLDLLRSTDEWWLGKGLGRFPASFFFGAPGNEYPGSYRLDQDGANNILSLAGPRYQIGFGEVLRISQRIHLGPPGRYRIDMDIRGSANARLKTEICTKHLLYAETCAGKPIHIASENPAWQHRSIDLDGRGLLEAPWYAPQFAVFSVALETLGGHADIDNLAVTDPLGNALVVNGDFSADMARWFFTSDRHHMPWHMKSMYLHVLFEQGILGLAAFMLAITAALARSMVGRKSHHPLAPAVVAGIVGFLIVGLFDSLLDAPRVAFLFFLVLMVAIQGRRQIE